MLLCLLKKFAIYFHDELHHRLDNGFSQLSIRSNLEDIDRKSMRDLKIERALRQSLLK